MSGDKNFWDSLQDTIISGANRYIEGQVNAAVPPTAPQPDATKSVLESMQAQLKSNMVLVFIIGFFVVAAVLMSGGSRRRGK